MYLITMILGIAVFGCAFDFSLNDIAIHLMFAIAGFIVGKL